MSTENETNDGGPAFPTGQLNRCDIEPGMSLRDWFAGMALQGMLCANAPAMDEVSDKNVDAVLAREAYNSADAMLAERKKRTK